MNDDSTGTGDYLEEAKEEGRWEGKGEDNEKWAPQGWER